MPSLSSNARVTRQETRTRVIKAIYYVLKREPSEVIGNPTLEELGVTNNNLGGLLDFLITNCRVSFPYSEITPATRLNELIDTIFAAYPAENQA